MAHFDTWLCPMDKEPPNIRDIIHHNSNIINKLKEVLHSVEDIYYMNGNHDMHVTKDDLSDITIGNKQIKHIKEYRSGLMKIEHGHKYAMFNAKDKLNDPLHGFILLQEFWQATNHRLSGRYVASLIML